MSSPTIASSPIVHGHEYTQRDKYGRTVVHVEAVRKDHTRHMVVVVTLPKVARAANPGQNYLLNDWDAPANEGVQYFAKRAEALKVAREIAGTVA